MSRLGNRSERDARPQHSSNVSSVFDSGFLRDTTRLSGRNVYHPSRMWSHSNAQSLYIPFRNLKFSSPSSTFLRNSSAVSLGFASNFHSFQSFAYDTHFFPDIKYDFYILVMPAQSGSLLCQWARELRWLGLDHSKLLGSGVDIWIKLYRHYFCKLAHIFNRRAIYVQFQR